MMKPRTGRGVATRERIINAAIDLFHKQGIKATSPNQIMEASRTGNSQFYHYFKSKELLVHEVVGTHIESIRAGRAPIDYDLETWDDLDRWFESQVRLQERYSMARGCPFGTIANDITPEEELLRQDLVLLFEVVRNKLASFFLREKASGRLDSSADEEALAEFCIASIQGGMLMGKLRRDAATVRVAVDHALHHLKSFRRPQP